VVGAIETGTVNWIVRQGDQWWVPCPLYTTPCIYKHLLLTICN